jgi:glucosamine 6-phosphate synthetase-like amidotransferase/phosphosugar isomerase protein
MCGIVGLYSVKNNGFIPKAEKALQDMMWANQLRGVHGAGLFTIDRNNKRRIIKTPSSFEFLAESKAYKDIANFLDGYKLVINHNRWATQGKIDTEHTHPFETKKIVLVHNGSLYHYPKNKDYLMDSHAIAELITEHGHEEMVNLVGGAYTLVW